METCTEIVRLYLQAALFEPPPHMLTLAIAKAQDLWSRGLLRYIAQNRGLQDEIAKRNRQHKEWAEEELEQLPYTLEGLAKDAANEPSNSLNRWSYIDYPSHEGKGIRGHVFIRYENFDEYYVIQDDTNRYEGRHFPPKQEWGVALDQQGAEIEVKDILEEAFHSYQERNESIDKELDALENLAHKYTKKGSIDARALEVPLIVDLKDWKYLRKRNISHLDANNILKKAIHRTTRNLTVTLIFMYEKHPVGSVALWNPRNWTITLWPPGMAYTLSIRQMKTELVQLAENVRHEMQHFAQSALDEILKIRHTGSGITPRAIRGPKVIVNRYGFKKGEPFKPRIDHKLRDIEFQPRLADSVDQFLRYMKRVDKKHWLDFIKHYTGIKNIKIPRNLSKWEWKVNDWFAYMLKQDRPRWKAAVKRFVAELDRRGIMDKAKRFNRLPILTPNHQAWGISIAKFYSYHPSLSYAVREYQRFISRLSIEQLVRHKQLVLDSGDTEYWVTPRWGKAKSESDLGIAPKKLLDHPKMPSSYRGWKH